MTLRYAIDGAGERELHGADFVALETSVLKVSGLAPGDEVVIGETLVFRGAEGAAVILLTDIQAIGFTSVAVWRQGRDIARAGMELAPSKMRQAEFDILWRELQAVWIDLLLAGRARALGARRQQDLPSLWRAVRPMIESICAHPQVQLTRGQGMAPYSKARDVDFSPSARLALGLALKHELPTRPIIGRLDTKSNRMVAALCDAVATAADRAGHAALAVDARRIRDHPVLRDLRADASPAPDAVVAKDQRYGRCWRALRQLETHATAGVAGPFPAPVGLVRLAALYEFWVYLTVARGVEQLCGPPLGAGYDVVGAHRGGNRLGFRLAPGTRIEFDRGMSVTYAPDIAVESAGDTGRLAFAAAPHAVNRVRPSSVVTPDVVVSGPGGLLVLDAKYSPTSGLRSTSQVLHAKYGGIHLRGKPHRRCREVIAVHPNSDFLYEAFAGYAALPMVPGAATDWLVPRLREVL